MSANGSESDAPHTQVAASAISARRTVAAEVSERGFVVAVRLFKEDVRRWDAYTFGRRVVQVADIAHDRYLANLPNPDGGQRYPSPRAVSEAERALDF